jgi:hypothetical protein
VSIETSNIVPFVDSTKARRLTNRETADVLTGVGAYVFQTSGKTPITPRFNQADDKLTVAEVEEAVEEHVAKHKYKPVQVGATRNPANVRKMYKRNIDAMWSIACGPSKIVVIDADQKDGGPAKIAAHFEKHGLPEGCVVVPTQSGGLHYYFSDPEGRFTNAAGLLKKDYGCDVRGRGGQCVAPGSIREDGKTYGTKMHLLALRDAIRDGTLPELPDHIVELIGTTGEAAQSVDNSELATVIKELEDTEWPTFEELFDPTIGEYDLEAFKAANPTVAELWASPSSDCSDNRWKLDQQVLEAFKMSAVHLAVLYNEWDGAGTLTDDGKGSGNYNLRDIAREWIKNKDRYLSKGDAMGAVVDDEDEAEVVDKKRCNDQPLFSYIEDVRLSKPRYIEWAIKHFLARGTTSIVSGKWGTGKTAVYTDIALHIAHGLPYRGRKVTKGVVIYVALENAEDVERRIRAWCDEMIKQCHDVSGGAFVIHRGPCTLYDQRGKATHDEKALIKIAQEASEHYGLPVSMIVIDTLSQAITPGSDREDGSIFTGAMQRIVNATGANVSTLHHPTKAGEAVRGDSALQGNVDTVIDVAREANGRGTIKAGSKFRIGDPAKVNFAYRLKPFEIGEDEDGEAITVVLAVEASTGIAMSAVDDVDDHAALTPADTPADKLVATLRVFRERVEDIAANTGEAVDKIGIKAGELFAALNKDRRASGLPELKDRTIVPRLLRQLVDGGEIAKSGDNRRTEYRLAV